MKKLVVSLCAAAGAIVLGASAAAWYALSSPPVENLALAPALISVASAEGQRLLESSASKADYAQLAPHLAAQTRRAFCGPATSAALINAALAPKPAVTQTSLFDIDAATEVKSELKVSVSGLTLDELAALLRAHGLQVQVVHANGADPGPFREAARVALAEARTFVVVNYDRRALKQAGAGHISPLGAYDAASDRMLVLDVASQKYPYTWVPAADLWAAMNTTDSDSRQTRGYLLATANDRP